MVTEVASTPKFLAFHQFEFHINCWIFNACACLYHFVLVHFYLIDSGQSPPFQKYVMFWVCPYDCNALCVCAFSWVTIKLHHSRRGWKCALQSGSKCLQFSRKPSLLPRFWRWEMMKELIEEALEEGGVEGEEKRAAKRGKERKQQQNNDEQRHNRKCGRQRRSLTRSKCA